MPGSRACSTNWSACWWRLPTRPPILPSLSWRKCANGWRPKAFSSRFACWARTSGSRKLRTQRRPARHFKRKRNMNHSRTLTTVCCLLVTALLASAQTPTPRAAPTPRPAAIPTPIPTPVPAPAPAPTAPMEFMDLVEPMEPMELMEPMEPMDLMQLVGPMEPMDLVAPMLPMEIDLGDLDLQMSMVNEMVSSPELQEQIEAAKEQAGRMKLDLKMFAREDMQAAKEMARAAQLAFAPQAIAPVAPMPPMPPMP